MGYEGGKASDPNDNVVTATAVHAGPPSASSAGREHACVRARVRASSLWLLLLLLLLASLAACKTEAAAVNWVVRVRTARENQEQEQRKDGQERCSFIYNHTSGIDVRRVYFC